jgi:hypothetical protein
MDRTINYTNQFIIPPKQTPTQTKPDQNDDVLDRIEREYGKEYNGSGFALEQFKQNEKNIIPINDSRSEKRV